MLIYLLSTLQASIVSGRWDPVEVEYHGHLAIAQLFELCLWKYGVDYYWESQDIEGKRYKIRVPRKQHYVADAMLRVYLERVTKSGVVLSRPSRGSEKVTKMWKPWGVDSAPKTFEGRVNRWMGSLLGARIDEKRELPANVFTDAK